MTSLKEYREDKNMLQKEVSDNADISKPYFSLIESGLRIPSLKNAKALAQVLELSLDDFYQLLFQDKEWKNV